jgi:3-dehydroquinate synthase
MVQRQIEVALSDRSYPLIAGTNMLSSFAPVCRRHGISNSLVVITDRNVARLHLRPLLRNLLHHKFQFLTITIPQGETQKTLTRANKIYTEMLQKKIMRNTTIIAMGGGVIGDLSGFIAATYQRGIKVVQIPTTLLAQVDSSIGGKVGVNHPLGKNMIGAFHQPLFVWMDTDYLRTLPKRELTCGLGEIIKYGVIWDADLFAYLESNLEEALQLETEVIAHVQSTCAAIKAEIVSKDEKESGIRIILNYGHTIGHGLESAGRYRLLKHGEAVMLGMIGEAFIAKEMKLLDADSYKRLVSLVRRTPMKLKISSLKTSDIINGMKFDKKRVGKNLRFVLPTKIGKVKVVDDVGPNLIRDAVREILKAI